MMRIDGAGVELKQTGAAADKLKEKKLRKACHDFEALMLKQLLTTMRKSIPKDGIFGGGYSSDMYQSMGDDALAQDMAKGRGMGLGDSLYRQLSRGPQSIVHRYNQDKKI
ncbi:MAG TPA: flagellar biosynthesis protein FlgJ [Desulfobacterales bacterium]|nr:flagellar biosynthesis protein FlgJ [Desulfobacterales bacterium]